MEAAEAFACAKLGYIWVVLRAFSTALFQPIEQATLEAIVYKTRFNVPSVRSVLWRTPLSSSRPAVRAPGRRLVFHVIVFGTVDYSQDI